MKMECQQRDWEREKSTYGTCNTQKSVTFMELNSQKKEKRGQNRKYSEKQWLKLTELVKVLSLRGLETQTG